jgi:hypothetical protein
MIHKALALWHLLVCLFRWKKVFKEPTLDHRPPSVFDMTDRFETPLLDNDSATYPDYDPWDPYDLRIDESFEAYNPATIFESEETFARFLHRNEDVATGP